MSALEHLPEGDGGAVVLVSTTAVNRLIDKMNALIALQISPQGIGSLKVGDKNAILDLSGIREYIVSQIQAVENGGAGGGPNGGGGTGNPGGPPGGSPGGGSLADLEHRLNNGVVEIECNGDGTATGRLRI